MAERKSFLVYRDWEDSFSDLSVEQIGTLFLAMFAYVNRGQFYDGEDPVIKAIFNFVRHTFDRDDEKYRKRCEQNSQNAKKRSQNQREADSEETGAAEGSQGDSKEADATEHTQPVAREANASERCGAQANAADIDKDKDKDIDRDKDRDRDKEKDICLAAASPIPAESEAAAGKKEFCLAAEDGNGGCSGKPQEANASPAQTARQEPLTADDQETASWFADRCRAVTGISPDHAQQKTLADWYKKHGEAAVERLFDEAKAHNAQRFGYFSAIMRRWEKTGVPGGQAKNRPQRGPEPRRDPSPAETARQQAALEENQRQLEKLLSDTAWMEDERGT